MILAINSFESALSSIVLRPDPNSDRPVKMVSSYRFVFGDQLSFYSHGRFLILFVFLPSISAPCDVGTFTTLVTKLSIVVEKPAPENCSRKSRGFFCFRILPPTKDKLSGS
jgi:hypothetical protein